MSHYAARCYEDYGNHSRGDELFWLIMARLRVTCLSIVNGRGDVAFASETQTLTDSEARF